MTIRIFKVYSWEAKATATEATDPQRNPNQELCCARSHEEAAEITQTVWHENGFDCDWFRVVELVLPETVLKGNFVGLIYEPNHTGKPIRLPLSQEGTNHAQSLRQCDRRKRRPPRP